MATGSGEILAAGIIIIRRKVSSLYFVVNNSETTLSLQYGERKGHCLLARNGEHTGFRSRSERVSNASFMTERRAFYAGSQELARQCWTNRRFEEEKIPVVQREIRAG